MSMRKKLPPLKWLRSFEASARYLNFTQAASELNLTQAAVSQQVKGLEHQLGMALFKRLPRGLELTDAGLAYMPVVHETLEKLAVATDEIFGKGAGKAITIKVSLIFFNEWLAPRLKDFYSQYPDVGIRFASNIWNSSEFNRDCDLEINHGQGNWPGLTADRLTKDALVPVCAPQLHFAQVPERVEQLSEHTLLHVLGYEEGWGHWLAQAGYNRVRGKRDIQCDTLIMALELAKQGLGVALGRSSMLQRPLQSGELIAPFDFKLPIEEGFYVCRPNHSYLSANGQLFLDWLLSCANSETAAD